MHIRNTLTYEPVVKEEETLVEKDRFTVKLIGKLSNYYGYAIRNNSHFIECANNAVR